MEGRVGQQFGNYRLIRLLGRGAFSEVYLGRNLRLDREVAVKVLRTFLADSDIESFITEARTIARLEHENIVPIYDADVKDGVPFLVMAHAPDGTLQDRHPPGTPLPPTVILPYVKQIAAALQYTHDNGMIHRDIKPQNMLVGKKDKIWLSDFGIAVIAHNTLSQITQDRLGTPLYMAPEQFLGKPHRASDQYALAVAVYQWLCGEAPFYGSFFLELFSKHMSAAPPSMRQKVPDITDAVEKVVLKALAKDPHDRFKSVQEFAGELERACKLEPYLLPVSSFDLLPPSRNKNIPQPLPAQTLPVGANQLDRPQYHVSQPQPNSEETLPVGEATSAIAAIDQPVPTTPLPLKNGVADTIPTPMAGNTPILAIPHEQEKPVSQPPIATSNIDDTRAGDKEQRQHSTQKEGDNAARGNRRFAALKIQYRWHAVFIPVLIIVLIAAGIIGMPLLLRQQNISKSAPPKSAPTHVASAAASGDCVKPTASLSIPPAAGIPVARDTFQRADQKTSWGQASDGKNNWQLYLSNSNNVFSICGKTGQMQNIGTRCINQEICTYSAILGPSVNDAEVILIGKVNQFVSSHTGAVTTSEITTLDAILQWQNDGSFYKAYINGTGLYIEKHVNGKPVLLGNTKFTANPDTFYTLEFQAQGTMLSAKVWPSNENEPTNSTLSVKDTSLASGQSGSGQGGIRVYMPIHTTINIAFFEELQLNR